MASEPAPTALVPDAEAQVQQLGAAVAALQDVLKAATASLKKLPRCAEIHKIRKMQARLHELTTDLDKARKDCASEQLALETLSEETTKEETKCAALTGERCADGEGLNDGEDRLQKLLKRLLRAQADSDDEGDAPTAVAPEARPSSARPPPSPGLSVQASPGHRPQRSSSGLLSPRNIAAAVADAATTAPSSLMPSAAATTRKVLPPPGSMGSTPSSDAKKTFPSRTPGGKQPPQAQKQQQQHHRHHSSHSAHSRRSASESDSSTDDSSSDYYDSDDDEDDDDEDDSSRCSLSAECASLGQRAASVAGLFADVERGARAVLDAHAALEGEVSTLGSSLDSMRAQSRSAHAERDSVRVRLERARLLAGVMSGDTRIASLDDRAVSSLVAQVLEIMKELSAQRAVLIASRVPAPPPMPKQATPQPLQLPPAPPPPPEPAKPSLPLVPASPVCVLCKDRPREVVLQKCGHCMLCRQCASAQRRCPACQQKIKKMITVIF